jgi:hypothetical protein
MPAAMALATKWACCVMDTESRTSNDSVILANLKLA